MTDKPKRKHNPAWSDPPENVARRNREARARKKALLDELTAILANYGLTIAQFIDGVRSGRIEITTKEQNNDNNLTDQI